MKVKRLCRALSVVIASTYSVVAIASAGRTPGHFSVSPLGAATYSIPIWVPPGIGGLTPKLSFVYDSAAPYDLMGPGWQLGGLSVITRCNSTYAQDGQAGPIGLSPADSFCLDGNRMRYTGTGPAGSGISEYQTEIADFSMISAVGTAGDGPAFFEVQGKDGLVYEYGNTPDSQVLPSPTVADPYIWALNKVTDLYGNYMTFTYVQSQGTFVPAIIQYSTVANSTTFPYEIDFHYSTKSSNDKISRYLAGTQLQQINQLDTVTIKHSGTVVHTYKLAYTTSSATLRATLTSITECGGSAGTDCLPATSIQYQNGTAGVASLATPSGSGTTDGMVYSVDIDGDGKQDLVFATTSGSNYQWWVQLATATGYGLPINTGILVPISGANIVLDDFDADGKTEIIAPSGTSWSVYQWNGTGFTQSPSGINVGSVGPGQAASADLDGDGLPEFLTVNGVSPTFTISSYRNTTSGGVFSFLPKVTVYTIPSGTGPAPTILGNNGFSNSSIKHMHFLGSTTDGVALSFNPGTGTVVLALDGTISGIFQVNSLAGTFTTVTPGNFNDDSCTDLYSAQSIAITGCNGANNATYATGATAPLVAAMDWDGDGRTDMLLSSGGVLQLYRSEATTFAPVFSTSVTSGTGTYIVTDQNGDGLDDLAFANVSGSYAIKYGLHNGAGTPPDLANSFKDGYGVTIAPTYVSIAEGSYTETPSWNVAVYPYRNYIGPLYVVSQASYTDVTNLPSGTFQKTFSYTSGWLNLQGRGFSGFNLVQSKDSRSGLWETFSYNQKFPQTGRAASYEISQDAAGSIPITSAWVNQTYTTLDATPNNQRYFLYNNIAVTKRYELGGTLNGVLISTTQSTFTFDNYGNATNISTTVTDNDATSPSPYFSDSWTTVTANTITPEPNTAGSWCLNLPTETTITNSSSAPGGAPITRTIQYNSPDYLHCRETEKVIEPGSALYKVTEDYTYDPTTGNLTKDTITGVGMAARIASISWNSTGQFPMTITNPLSQSITLGFDANTGNLTSQTDPNYTASNPLTTSWGYDNFGRKTLETRPDGTSTAWAYNNCTTAGCVNPNNKLTVTETIKNVGGTAQSVRNAYLDSLDRPLVNSVWMIDGSYNQVEMQYDSMGNLFRHGAPCTFVLSASCTTFWTTNNYDNIHRLTSSVSPKSAADSTPETTHIQYLGATTVVTDPLGHNTTKITMPTGLLGRSIDHYGYYQDFTYDAFGSLTKVIDNATPANTLFTAGYAYGVSAFQTSSTDADLGSQSNTIDALGELLNHQDAKGQNVQFTYDALSRPKTRTELDLTTTWTWGNSAASFNIGSLQSISSVDSLGTYSETYVYDSKARLSTATIVIPGDAAYTYTQTYNATTGLPDTLTYPVSTASFKLKLQYGYTNGFLTKISDFTSGTAYWTANTLNARGQYAQETLGNGVVVTHDFDAMRGWPNSIKAGLGGGSALQNNGYAFDAMANLIQRQDNNQGITENFTYDGLYRFMNSTLNSVADESRTYDVTGNVLSWSVFGATVNNLNYTTPQAGCTYYANTQPHAVRGATQGAFSGSFCYDANGNTASGGGGFSATWTSYNQPSFINGGFGGTSTFFYNANHQRYKQIENINGAIETSIYVGGLVEKVSNSTGTFYRQYVPAGNTTVLSTLVASSGANSTVYLTKDHLGSSAVVTDSSGALVFAENFSAFGISRASNWTASGTFPNLDSVSERGFTGQEMIRSIGAVDLNGRLLNNSSGRMYSPDPFVPDPGNTQSFNRYSYVNNSPLSRVDPSGFVDEPAQDPMDTIFVTSTYTGSQNAGTGGSYYNDTNFSISGKALEATGLPAGSKLPSARSNPAHPQNSATASRGPQVAAFALDVGPMEFVSPDIGALVGAVPAVSMATPASGPGGAGGGGGDLHPSLAQFNDRISVESAERQMLLAQSKNFTTPPSAFSTLPSHLLADSKRAGHALLMAASLLPFLTEEGLSLDALLFSSDRSVAENGLSRAAQKISSHAQRVGGTFPKLTGSVAEQNARAQSIVREFLESPNAVPTRLSRGGFEIRLPNGQGIRFNADGSFDTVLDPRR